VPVRATEDTILDRLPARLDIRRGAVVELPHVIMLVDDCDKQIVEPVYQNRHNLQKLYDFELNMQGGRIAAYKVENGSEIIEKIDKLTCPKLQQQKYGQDAKIIVAVGDGNHSMAAAKVLWEEMKKNLSPAQQQNHPARFFLAELVNLYGGGMDFEPIHRIVFNADDNFVNGLKAQLEGDGSLKLLTKNGVEFISAPKKASEAIRAVQNYLDDAIKNNGINVEYVHNECRLADILTEHNSGLGIVMPKFPKDELFNYVVNVGNLPKKAFSIGEPEHKRYYLEAKLIVSNK
jgi:hypothetical protein